MYEKLLASFVNQSLSIESFTNSSQQNRFLCSRTQFITIEQEQLLKLSSLIFPLTRYLLLFSKFFTFILPGCIFQMQISPFSISVPSAISKHEMTTREHSSCAHPTPNRILSAISGNLYLSLSSALYPTPQPLLFLLYHADSTEIYIRKKPSTLCPCFSFFCPCLHVQKFRGLEKLQENSQKAFDL